MFYTSHKRHNRIAEKAGTFFPIRVSEGGRPQRSHPWQMLPIYNKEEKKWSGTFLPGLVNGLPPYVTMLYKNAPLEAQARIDEEKKEAGKEKAAPNDSVFVYLDEGGAITFDSFKDFSKGGAPEFFKKLGASDPVANRAGELESTATRLLKSCDIVLQQPRPSLTNKVDYGIFGAGVRITSTPGLFVPQNREAFLISVPVFVEKKEPPSFRNVFFNTFVDTGRDEFHLMRFFLLSPPLPLLNENDLSIWQPFMQYNCHYNLVHATQQIAKAKTNYEKPLTIQTGLAFGLADSIFNNLLTGGLNVGNDVLAYLNQRNLGGKFYVI